MYDSTLMTTRPRLRSCACLVAPEYIQSNAAKVGTSMASSRRFHGSVRSARYQRSKLAVRF